MAIALILIGLLIMSIGGLWYLGVAFSESIFWGLSLLGLSVASVIFSLGAAGGAYGTELTVIFQVCYWVLTLTFLFQYWEVVKRPFFLSIIGSVVVGIGVGLGGAPALSGQGTDLMARLKRPDSSSEYQNIDSAPPRDYRPPSGNDEDMRMFDAIAEQYEREKENGMQLDPRYDQAVRDYQAMRGRESGSSSASGQDQGYSHGGSSGPNLEPDPLIGSKEIGGSSGGQDYSVSRNKLLAASQAAKQGKLEGGSGMSNNPWYLQYRLATRPTIAAWQRIHLAVNDSEHRKDLSPACRELVRASSSLPRGIFNGAPDERISLQLSQAYDTLLSVGRDCMAGRMSAMREGLKRASEEMGRAQNAMAPFRMRP